MAEKSAIALLLYLKVEGSVECEVIDEKGYKMKKEYIKPEAEMMKFVEAEEIMTDIKSVTELGVWYDEVNGFKH